MFFLRVISFFFLIFSILLKFQIISLEIYTGIDRYLLNASIILFSFSVILPLISAIKFKSMNTEKNDYISQIFSEININKSVDIYVTKSSLIKAAGVLYRGNKPTIIINQLLLNTLTFEQLKFVLAHEYCHIQKQHLIKNILSLIFVLSGIPILLLILSSYFIKISSLIIVLSFSVVIYIGLIIVHFIFSQRREYIADKYAMKIVGLKTSKETLKSLKKQNLISERSYTIFETHPSLKKRLENLSI